MAANSPLNLGSRTASTEAPQETTSSEYATSGENVRPTQQATGSNVTGEISPAAGEASNLQVSASSESLASNSQQAQYPTQSASQPNVVGVQSNRPAAFTGSGQNQAQPGGARFSEADDESEILIQPEDDGLFASVFSSTGLLVALALGIFAFLVSRKVRPHDPLEGGDKVLARDRKDAKERFENKLDPNTSPPQHQSPLLKADGSGPANGPTKTRTRGTLLTVTTPDSHYGAYRIDQEVGKLVLGQPHRMDVLSSRAPSDRRAIETSLVKIIRSSSDENEQRRAREALEGYGFVARECTALLVASDPFERTSAARSLGETKSPSALPFLLEALYDHESIVRNQAVVSIGELRLPKAIGALLDVARQHPDVPASLLSRALSACSVEGLDSVGGIPQPCLVAADSDSFFDEINHLRTPSSVEDLPECADDEVLSEILSQIQSPDPAVRAEATKALAQYQVRSAVIALSSRARRDPEAAVRAQAISSLAAINHESVFPAVLIGMADESREVRAAAARSLSRLSFDRADAYVRLIETADDEMLREVASACIQAGIAAQGIDRLVSDRRQADKARRQEDGDRRRAQGDRLQAYEAFAIVSLLAKAKLTHSIVEAISNHPNVDVRLAAVQLLARMTEPEFQEQLRTLSLQDGIGEDIRTALLEGIYKIDQAQLKDEEPLTVSEVEEAPGFNADGALKRKNDLETKLCGALETQADEIEI